MEISRYLPIVATLAVLAVVAVEARRFGAVQRSPRPPANTVQRLHEVLAISDDPNEDIRTNVLLNMEGI